ncbi:hypothetical protein [Hyphomicrobium facile]|uniref:Uncharacterized protein n=1 Tax=Hyphomicrobium facile TaxID=51670 RepID=A0A1I7N5T3_9HYPH|nr:hypothetical protein [Hyphomicrobium facile]SFV30037.1 hypothetical protein SAMN04488557_1395 [Hyphomicrobium facile]
MTTRKKLKTDLKHLWFIGQNIWVFVFLMRYRRRPTGALFREGWKMLDRNSSAFNNYRKIPARNIRHYDFRQIFKYFFPNFEPEVTLSDRNIIDELCLRQSIITTIHSKGEYAILAALDRAGLKTAMITASPMNTTRLASYGFQNPPLNILRTSSTFVEARAALRDGYTLLCDVDYVPNRKSANADRYISTSLFDFQRLVKAQLFFAHMRIGEEGEMECVIERAPDSDNSNESSVLTANNFIAFIDKIQEKPSKLKVGNWSAHIAQKTSSRRN